MRFKKGVIWDTLIPWLIVAAVIVLGFLSYVVFSGKLQGIGDWVKTFLRFGR